MFFFVVVPFCRVSQFRCGMWQAACGIFLAVAPFTIHSLTLNVTSSCVDKNSLTLLTAHLKLINLAAFFTHAHSHSHTHSHTHTHTQPLVTCHKHAANCRHILICHSTRQLYKSLICCMTRKNQRKDSYNRQADSAIP